MRRCLVVVLLLLWTPAASSMCGDIHIRALYRDAAAVFAGKVVNMTNESDGPNRRFATVMRIKVARSWKGVRRGQVVEVRTGPGEDGFAFFKKGKKFLVIAYTNGRGQLATSACQKTVRLSDPEAKAEIDSLETFQRFAVGS